MKNHLLPSVKSIKFRSLSYFFLFWIFSESCSKNGGEPTVVELPVILPAIDNVSPSTEVLMQAFYWDVPAGGTWWNNVSAKLDSWKSAGITQVWLPPVSKAQSGAFSMGYDPLIILISVATTSMAL